MKVLAVGFLALSALLLDFPSTSISGFSPFSFFVPVTSCPSSGGRFQCVDNGSYRITKCLSSEDLISKNRFTSTIVTPAPTVVVQQPVVTTPVVAAPVQQVQSVWVEGRYVDTVQPNGTVLRTWQPGHYEQRTIQIQ